MAHATVSYMTESETLIAFCEGLKMAASCARELAALTDSKDWLSTAVMLDGMRENGYKLARMKAMRRSEVTEAIRLKQHPVNGVNVNPLKK